MRISDWSSDVCSSDLPYRKGHARSCRTLAPPSRRSRLDGLAPLQHDSVVAIPDHPKRKARDEQRRSPHRQLAATSISDKFHLLTGSKPRPAVQAIQHQEALQLVIGEGHAIRSEEQTSELQSLMRIPYAVFCSKKTKH